MSDTSVGAVARARVRGAARRVRSRLTGDAHQPSAADPRPAPGREGLPAGVVEMLGAPQGRVVSIVAAPGTAKAVRPWVRRLHGDDVTVYHLGRAGSGGKQPGPDVVVVDDLEELTERLAMRNEHAVLVVVLPTSQLPPEAPDHYDLLAHLLPQLGKQGTYVVDRSVDRRGGGGAAKAAGSKKRRPKKAGPAIAPERWHRLLASGEVDPAYALTRPELVLSRLVRTLFVSRDVAVIGKRGLTPFKVREDETRSLLTQRESGVRVDILDTRPGGSLEVKVREASYGPGRAEPWPDRLSYPPMLLRHYQGDLVSQGGMLLRAGNTLLPESFRWPLDLRLGQPHADTLSDRFSRIDTRPAKRRLEGSYYFLDCVFSGHFGHLTTEVLCRLWGWEQAKREIPDLKALFHTRRKDGKNGDLERRLFTAFGIAESDLVASNVPVRLDSVVGASPMWHNQDPHYVHPDIQETWAKMTAGLLGDAEPAQHERIFVSRGPSLRHRRGCNNQEEVEQFFADRGFHVFYPETLPLPEQVALFAGARVVAGFGGSALFNLMHTRRLESLIVLSSHAYVARNEHMFTSLLGGELHYFWGPSDIPPPKVGRARASDRSSWTLELSEVGDDLDRVLRSA